MKTILHLLYHSFLIILFWNMKKLVQLVQLVLRTVIAIYSLHRVVGQASAALCSRACGGRP